MKNLRFSVGMLFGLSLMLSACQGSPAAVAATEPAAIPVEPAIGAQAPATPAVSPSQAAPANTAGTTPAASAPGWYAAALSEARTGETFSIDQFRGQVVLVETMAVWCSKCYDQQRNLQWLHDRIGPRQDFVSISLDIDPFEDLAYLQNYLASNPEFSWRYAVAPLEVSRQLAALYGDQFLNPPSTPILLIDRRGAAHPLGFGLKSVEDLLQAVQPYLDESV